MLSSVLPILGKDSDRREMSTLSNRKSWVRAQAPPEGGPGAQSVYVWAVGTPEPAAGETVPLLQIWMLPVFAT